MRKAGLKQRRGSRNSTDLGTLSGLHSLKSRSRVQKGVSASFHGNYSTQGKPLNRTLQGSINGSPGRRVIREEQLKTADLVLLNNTLKKRGQR